MLEQNVSMVHDVQTATNLTREEHEDALHQGFGNTGIDKTEACTREEALAVEVEIKSDPNPRWQRGLS